MSATTNSSTSPAPRRKWLAWVSSLLKSVWTFFPSLLFIILMIVCFWTTGQGKDILVAYMEKGDHAYLGGATRIVFFIAIAFWVYVTWYSSRIIAYIKEGQEQDQLKQASEIDQYFLDNFPRIGGNACLLVLELAILQSPATGPAIGSGFAAVLFFALLLLLFFVDRTIREKWALASSFRTIFRITLFAFLLLLIAAAFLEASARVDAFFSLGLLVLFHVLFLLYINLRRKKIEGRKEEVRRGVVNEDKAGRSLFERIMDYFCIPRVEAGYFSWYLLLLLAGILLDWAAILYLPFARGITPFPMIVLGFSVLLMLGNVIAAFSVRYLINFHFIVFLLALFVSRKENHFIRTIPLEGRNNEYAARPALRAYLSAWLNDRVPVSDSVKGSAKGSAKPDYDVYFVLSNGGGSRSGYWTGAVLGSLEDASLAKGDTNRFSRHLFCLSGTSGGGVGVATFFSMLKDQRVVAGKSYKSSAADYLSQDYFTYTAARMLGPDYFHYIFPFGVMPDRGRALESSMEASSLDTNSSDYRVPFADNLSGFKALDGDKVVLPILFVNTTRMQDGNPAVVSNLNLKLDQVTFNDRVDVLSLLDSATDISMASGAVLGGRFPYFSPGGRIGNQYFVDGGYFDNSGAGVVQELIQGMLDIMKTDSLRGGDLWRQFHRLHFRVVHIVNSPLGGGDATFTPVTPIQNDLFSPVDAILGAYDMQTTVNDDRLIHFIGDINAFSGIGADYQLISLYKRPWEYGKDTVPEPSYSMNWFMSDTTRRRIWNRVGDEPVLKEMIKNF